MKSYIAFKTRGPFYDFVEAWKVVLLALLLLVFLLIAVMESRAQESPATAAPQVLRVSFSPQPLETFRARFGGKPKGVALVGVRACNLSFASLTLDSGHIHQAAEMKMALVDEALVLSTLRAARGRSWKAIGLKGAKWAGGLGSLLTASGAISANDAVQVGLAAGAIVVQLLQGQLNEEHPDPASLVSDEFLRGELALAPGACKRGLLLAKYDSTLRPFTIELIVPAPEVGTKLEVH